MRCSYIYRNIDIYTDIIYSIIHKSIVITSLLYRCTTPHGTPGTCIGLQKCNNILVLLRKPIPAQVRLVTRVTCYV